MFKAGLLNLDSELEKKKYAFFFLHLSSLLYTYVTYLFTWFKLVVTSARNTYDVLELKLDLPRYCRLLSCQFIKQKISSLDDLEGLFVNFLSFFHIFLMLQS